MYFLTPWFLRKIRRLWYKLKRYRWRCKRMWDRFKWCIIGGFAYAAGRALFYYLQDFIR